VSCVAPQSWPLVVVVMATVAVAYINI